MPALITISSIPSRAASQLPPAKHSGFSLVEMAIVLVIVAFLATSGLAILSAQQEARRIQDTQTLLDAAKEALIGFAASHSAADVHPHLPCPDKTTAAGAGVAPNLPNDGLEDRTVAGGCVVTAGNSGNLPWATLGLPDSDSWSNRFRYQVTPAFSNSSIGFTLTSLGDITINNAAGTAMATTVPAVILSHGPNGFGAINSVGNPTPVPTGASELENTDAVANTTFISNPPVPIGGPGGEFDDIVTWISPNILFSRMLAAGRLP